MSVIAWRRCSRLRRPFVRIGVNPTSVRSCKGAQNPIRTIVNVKSGVEGTFGEHMPGSRQEISTYRFPVHCSSSYITRFEGTLICLPDPWRRSPPVLGHLEDNIRHRDTHAVEVWGSADHPLSSQNRFADE